MPGREELCKPRRFTNRMHGATYQPVREIALLRDASNADTGSPVVQLDKVIAAARYVRKLAEKHERFSGAEVDLAVAREIRGVSEAAERAAENLARMIEVLEQ